MIQALADKLNVTPQALIITIVLFVGEVEVAAHDLAQTLVGDHAGALAVHQDAHRLADGR